LKEKKKELLVVVLQSRKQKQIKDLENNNQIKVTGKETHYKSSF